MIKKLEVTILGCGPSTGVPVIGNKWGRCDPENPKNRRLRPSIFINLNGNHILIDTSPDLREQLLSINCKRLDAVFFTHAHSDHIHGFNDLRNINRLMKKDIPIYADQTTLNELKSCFAYAFKEDPKKSYFKPGIDSHLIEGDFEFVGQNITVIQQSHGVAGTSLGFRIGDFAYCTDVVSFEKEEFAKLAGIKYWIVDGYRYEEHPTHAHIQKVIEWADMLKPDMTYLTHMNQDLDYEILSKELPYNIKPSYDGLKLKAI